MDRKVERSFRLPLSVETEDDADVYILPRWNVTDADGYHFCDSDDRAVSEYICKALNDEWQGYSHIEFDSPFPIPYTKT